MTGGRGSPGVLLAVDVGNSHTVVGVFRGRGLTHSWRLTTDREATADEVAALLGQLCAVGGVGLSGIDAAVVASVVPPLRGVWREVAERYLRCVPLVLEPGLDVGLTLEVRHPGEVGADRIADALAVWKRYGAPAIVVDCGTATTVDAVAEGGRYLGGAIAPGIGISAEALFARAALLYRVELMRPPRALGTDTATQVQSGIVLGFAGQIDALVRHVRREMGGADHVVATGGLAPLVAPACETVTAVDPHLTLHGLRLAHEARTADPREPRPAR